VIDTPASHPLLSDVFASLSVEAELLVQDGAQASSALPPVRIPGLSADSRHLRDGEAFVALPGGSVHGLDFLNSVEDRASIVIADKQDVQERSVDTCLPVVMVQDLAQRLGDLVSACNGHPSRAMSVCGITGTDGKTSTARFVVNALQLLGKKAGFIGTIGWGIGDDLTAIDLTTPSVVDVHAMLAVLRENGAEFIVMEVSSHALVQGRVDGVWFDVAVLTNLGRDHLDYHLTVDNYKAAKKKLFTWSDLSAAVINADDDFGLELLHQMQQKIPGLCGYATATNIADTDVDRHVNTVSQSVPMIQAQDVCIDSNGLSFTLYANDEAWQVNSTLMGRFNISNMLAAVGVLRSFGIPMSDSVNAISKLQDVPGRMEAFKKADMPSLVVDFAHTPQALESALRTVREHCSGQLWVVFGCGGDRDAGKRPLMGAVAEQLADKVIVTDDNPRSESSSQIIADIVAGMSRGDYGPANGIGEGIGKDEYSLTNAVSTIADRKKAIITAFENAKPDDWILVAGKGHESVQIVGAERRPFSDREIAQMLAAGEVA